MTHIPLILLPHSQKNIRECQLIILFRLATERRIFQLRHAMRRLFLLASLTVATSSGASVMLSEHDFDTNTSGLSAGNGGAVTTTIGDPNDPAASGTAAYIDNWSFSVTNTPVPEPKSALLVLLGGLGLIRRRR